MARDHQRFRCPIPVKGPKNRWLDDIELVACHEDDLAPVEIERLYDVAGHLSVVFQFLGVRDTVRHRKAALQHLLLKMQLPLIPAQDPLALPVPQDQPPQLDPRALMSLFGLTPSEAQLAVLRGEGQSVAQIASELAIAKNTARFVLETVHEKLGVSSHAELAAKLAPLVRLRTLDRHK